MKFKSQICTSIEQSKRLLELGLKKETADMHHYKWSEGYWDIEACPPRGDSPRYIPAWSLYRLLEMIATKRKVMLVRIGDDLFNTVIEMIRKLITDGTFNKDYLEE